MEIVVDVSFLMGRFSMKRAFNKDCGVNVKFAQFRTILGQMVCADDFDALPGLPDASDQGPRPEIRLAAQGESKEDIEQGERVKNLCLGIAMVLFYGLSILLLCYVAFVVFHRGKTNAHTATDSPIPSQSARTIGKTSECSQDPEA